MHKSLIITAQWWAGHVGHMSDDRLLKQLFEGQLHAGKCLKNKPWKSIKIEKKKKKRSLVNIKIDPGNWEKLALKKSEWRIYMDDSCTSFEREQIEHANL